MKEGSKVPRKGFIAKREVLPDPIYNNVVVTKLINNIMLDGKKGRGLVVVEFRQIRKMGSFSQILGMLPGIDKKMLESVDTEENEKKMLHIEAIIQSMTQEERRKPSIIGASRKVRISKGSGTRVQDVNQLLKQFEQMQKMMKQLSGGRQAKMLKRLRKRK